MNTELEIFLKQAKSRSDENSKAFSILLQEGLYGVAIGMLRQELDTLIRLSYLWIQETSKEEAISLIKKSVAGENWSIVNHKGKKVKITDRDMLNLATHLGGWGELIYSFGCKLIHLSDYHLYASDDPFGKLDQHTKSEIVEYLKRYHEYHDLEINFNRLVNYLPKIMEKLKDNVDFYIEEVATKLEDGSQNP